MELLIFFIPGILFVGYATLIICYRQWWKQIPGYQLPGNLNESSTKKATTHITIIIPARNEALTIGVCIRSIIGQTYPASLFEVLVVDDHSTDDTASIVASFGLQNIRCIFLKDFVSGTINSYKKKAIEVAIAQAAGELIITTDADCFMGKYWLETIASFYEKHQPAFIAAPVAINISKSFLSIFQALDFMTLQGITGAAVHKQLHSMCNGANLAYQKKTFLEVDGFKGIDTIASGDDMLLMHKIFQLYPQRVLFLKSSGAVVSTQAMDTWKSFLNQRIRWASKADKYTDKRIFPVLMLVYFFNFSLVLLPLLSLFNNRGMLFFSFQVSLIYYWLVLLILKTLVELFFLFPVARFFNNINLLKWFPVAQPFHILYTIAAGWLGKFGNYQWKGRKVK